jgi:gamma-glutamyltranspeptidase / glutathione hydrolase
LSLSAHARLLLVSSLSIAVAGCGTVRAVKRTVLGGSEDTGPKILAGFIGGVVADEPRAALAGRQVLALGGNAADAAVATGFMLAVTLPSRAALGGGGACIAFQAASNSPNGGAPEAILFPAAAPATNAGDRPAAVPMTARGLYVLSARYGTRNFAALLAPAAQAARDGFPMSRALAFDLAPVGGPLTADPSAAAVFAPHGAVLGEGGTVQQTDLADTLDKIRTLGAGDLYQGLLAHRLAESSVQAGGPITTEDLRAAVPIVQQPLISAAGNDQVAFLPQPADGGLAATAAFRTLRQDANAVQAAEAAAQAAVPRVSTPLPASTSFVAVDRKGDAVACALSMNNLFGTGRIAPGTGVLLAASPAAKPAALLTAGIAWNPGSHAFRAAVGASGQNAAGLAGGYAMANALAGAETPVPEPGRANVISCPNYVPGGPESCRMAVDPRVAGLAAGSN